MHMFIFLFLKFILYFILNFERGREKIPSRLHAVGVEPKLGLDPMNHEVMN